MAFNTSWEHAASSWPLPVEHAGAATVAHLNHDSSLLAISLLLSSCPATHGCSQRAPLPAGIRSSCAPTTSGAFHLPWRKSQTPHLALRSLRSDLLERHPPPVWIPAAWPAPLTRHTPPPAGHLDTLGTLLGAVTWKVLLPQGPRSPSLSQTCGQRSF